VAVDCAAVSKRNNFTLTQFFSQVGQSAVPINMIILGINLSSTFQKKSKKVSGKDDAELSNRTMFALVVAKMIVMPIIGILSTWFLEHNYTPFPDGEYWTSMHITSWIWRLTFFVH
jgi:predicted permease